MTSNRKLYTVGHYQRIDGTDYARRVNMRKYSLATARKLADSVRRGFVCEYGKHTVVHVGAWQ